MVDWIKIDTPPSNELLARVYDEKHFQTIIIFPLVWQHRPYDNWFLKAVFPCLQT